MSWVEQELKRRTRAQPLTPQDPAPAAPAAALAAEHVATLWRGFEAANQALPEALRLRVERDWPQNPMLGAPTFAVWLGAPNGAGLGLADDGIRYLWPFRSRHASFNFWVRWRPPAGFVVVRRVGPVAAAGSAVERPFDERRVEYIVKCLVLGRRVTPRSVRRKRWWLF